MLLLSALLLMFNIVFEKDGRLFFHSDRDQRWSMNIRNNTIYVICLTT